MMQHPQADLYARHERESRMWAMLAHLALFGNILFAYTGLIVAIVIYTSRKNDPPVARENQRHALNFEIAFSILNSILLFVFLGFVFDFDLSNPPAGPGAPLPWQVVGMLSGMGVLFIVYSAVSIFAVVGAFRAWNGRPFRYFFAFPFVRAKPLSVSPTYPAV